MKHFASPYLFQVMSDGIAYSQTSIVSVHECKIISIETRNIITGPYPIKVEIREWMNKYVFR